MRDDPPSITAVFEHLGGEVRTGRDGWNKVRCIFHEDRTPSASINEDRGRFQCFPCDLYEDAYGLLMLHHNFTFKEALRFVGEHDFESAPAGGTGRSNGLLRRANDGRNAGVSRGKSNQRGGSKWSPPWLRG